MQPDVLKELVMLVDSKVLPKEAIPRLVYCGHTFIASIRESVRKYYCIKCKHNFTFTEDVKNDIWSDFICPECHSSIDVYDITGDTQKAKWRCVCCNYEWVSQNGYTCPKCKTTVDNRGKVIDENN